NNNLRGIKDKTLALPARKVEKVSEPGKEGIVRDTPGELAATFELSDVDDRSTTILHARLEGVSDHFPLDDEAWLVVGIVRKARVLIVGSENPVLEAFFDNEATRSVVTVTHQGPEALTKEDAYRRPARNGEYDLVIFDRC